MSDMKIDGRKVLLVFGISGFVGPYLAREFRVNGYEVVGTDVTNNGNVPEFVETRTCDILDGANVEALIKSVNPTHIINLAAISSVGLSWNIPQKTVAVNVEGAINILEAARKCETTPRLLFIGSSEEYAISDKPISEDHPLDANNPYGLSKEMLEKTAGIYRNRYGLATYFVRAFNHTGIGQTDTFVIPSWCKQVAEITKSGKPAALQVGNLGVKRDFSDVRDIVRGYRLVIESDNAGEVYNIGSGTAYSLRELLDYIVSLSNQKITIEVDSGRIRGTDNDVICCDNSKIRTNFGWGPEHDIKETISEIFEHYCGNGVNE